MSELRLWIHEQIARLDGRRERRFVALAAALAFAVLAIGPQALRVVDAAVNAPDIRIDELGPDPVTVPLRFHATTLNIVLEQVVFVVQMPNGAALEIPGRTTATNPSRWESEPFDGQPGQAYVVKARGSSPAANVQAESSQAMTFTVFDPNATAPPPAGGTATGDPATNPPATTEPTVQRTVEIEFAVAHSGAEARIEAKGLTTGFEATSAHYRVLALTGQNFLAQPAATRGADGKWHAIFPVPGGALYRVTLVASDAGTPLESLPRDLTVPLPETAPPPADPAAPAPVSAPAPAVSLLAPAEGAEALSPIPLAARIVNATATSVTFEVIDPAGVTRTLAGGAGAAGNWSAMFVGLPGQYGVRFRTVLTDGAVIPPANYRPFRILPPPEPTASATASPPAPAATTQPSVPAPPVVELFAPAPDAPPFAGPVPLSARVQGGTATRMVAIVTANAGGETVVVASKTAAGDFWNGVFEGPDGEYRFRMRATVGGQEHFSPERRFSVKRPPTAAQLPPATPTTPTTEVSPPAPAPAAATTTDAAPPTPPQPPSPPSLAASTAPPATAPVPDALAAECRAAGVLPERCAEWLKAKLQSRECLEAGARTREACAALLARLGRPADETQLFGLAAERDLEQAREDAARIAAAPVRRETLPPSIAALLPVEKPAEEFVRVVAVAGGRADASPALLVLDADGDGLPDDHERRLGTDPGAPDTDGDGFTDGMEVKNGYNPLGAGALESPVRGVEKALLEGLPLEEPRGAETLADPSFSIAAETPPPSDGEEAPAGIRLSGVAAPNSVVTIFIYSYLPVVVTTTTDANGNWTYEFGSKLAEGRHEAYVSVNDDTGKIVATSSPLAFFVREAQAVTEEDFLRPDVNVEEAPAELSRWFVYGGIGLVALALVLVAAIIRQVRKSPMPDAGEGL